MINSNYDSLTDAKRAQLISSLYIDKKLSFINISKQYQTYPNRLRRDAIRFNIPIRSKSEAQKNALETGSHLHPTKGTVRSTKVKDKIGLGVMKNWESMDPATLKDRKIKSKEMWDALSDSDKQNMLHLANLAVRESSKVGSKLEKFILQLLVEDGYKVEFHKEQVLANTKLQIDLFLPTMNVAIEIDGPSHFQPVWGDKTLQRNQKYDNKKNGLIIGKGWKLIRIKQTGDFSKARAKAIYEELLLLLKSITTNTETLFSIGDR